MSHPDDGQLHALVDGELSVAEATELQTHLDACEACRRRLDEARQLLDESDRIVARLDVPPKAVAPSVRARPRIDYRVLGLAASALLVVTAGWLVLRPGRASRDSFAPQPSVAPAADAAAPAPEPAAPTAAIAPSAPARRDRQAPTTNELAQGAAPARAASPAERKAEMSKDAQENQLDDGAARAAAPAQAMRADTPPSRPAAGVELNDLPPWKPKVMAPTAAPAAARFHVDGLDVVSSAALPGGGIRLTYSVNGTPVEFDQVPTGGPPAPKPADGDVHTLSWPRDGFDLTLRSKLPLGELERLRQQVR